MFSRTIVGLLFGVGLTVSAPVFVAQAGSPLDDPATVAKIADQLAATSDALDALTKTVHPETFDVKALANSLGGADPAALRDWVAANTRTLAYAGTLKGANGTLEDRAGNSLDRSLLLAALLSEKGVEVRLARAALGGEPAAALYAKTLEAALPRLKSDEAAQNAVLDKLASDPRIDGGGAAARIAKGRQDAALRDEAAKAMAATITAALSAAVPAVASNAEQDAAAAKQKALVVLADHWWVQANIGGVWTDLDTDGVAVDAAQASTMMVDAIPADMKHTVTVRVVAEFARDGKLSTQVLLEHPIIAAEAQGKLIGFTHRAVDMKPMDKIDLTAADDEPLLKASAAATVWVPAISDDAKVATNLLVTADGVTMEATPANIGIYDKAVPMGGMASAIDAIPGGDTPDDGKPKPVFTAEWIEIEIATPGAPSRTEKRMVFDAIGPAARVSGAFTGALDDAAKAARGLAMVNYVDLTILTGAMAPDRAINRSAGLLALGFKATSDWLKNGREGSGPSYPKEFRPTSFPLAGFAIGRDAYAADHASPRLTEANVALLRDGLRITPQGVRDFTQFDIVANGVDRGDPRAALAAGVADTVTEHVLLGAPAETTNTAARYAADIAAGKSWTTAAPGDATALAALAADADTLEALKTDSSRGYVIVAPAKMTLADATWWRVDPVSGETLGMTPLGGQEVVEEISTNMFVFGLIGTAACTVKAKNAIGGADMPSNAKVGGVIACYAGVLVGIMTFEGAAILGLAIGAGGTLADEVK